MNEFFALLYLATVLLIFLTSALAYQKPYKTFETHYPIVVLPALAAFILGSYLWTVLMEVSAWWTFALVTINLSAHSCGYPLRRPNPTYHPGAIENAFQAMTSVVQACEVCRVAARPGHTTCNAHREGPVA